jgi:poly(hydroxyalkanoate) granule-associated protein
MARKTRTVRKTRVTPATTMQKARASVRKTLASIAQRGAAFSAASREGVEAVRDVAENTRDVAVARVVQARARTAAAVSGLEQVFEQRVSRAIAKLGVPTTKDVKALSRQVAQLQAKVDRMSRSRARA